MNDETLKMVMQTIEKDVLRTDRTFGFYAGSSENNANLQSLFHILGTYCASHSTVKYCQGSLFFGASKGKCPQGEI